MKALNNIIAEIEMKGIKIPLGCTSHQAQQSSKQE
jgi:hypothetical protein